MSWTTERARVAALSRDRADNDPELLAARRNLRAERLTDRIAKLAADYAEAAPELTPERRARIAALLAPVVNAEGGI